MAAQIQRLKVVTSLSHSKQAAATDLATALVTGSGVHAVVTHSRLAPPDDS